MTTSTHLIIADDHPLFRDALRQAVASVVNSAKIDEAGSFEELTSLLEQDSDVDMVLLDLSMPGISGFELCQTLSSLSFTQQIPIFIVRGRMREIVFFARI